MSEWRKEIKEYGDLPFARELWCYKKLDKYEDKIDLLNKQIENMKCCHNCNHVVSLKCQACTDNSNWEMIK